MALGPLHYQQLDAWQTRRIMGFMIASTRLRLPILPLRQVRAGIEPSVGSVGDSSDNALAEAINGHYKTELQASAYFLSALTCPPRDPSL
ncbi:hypothetical protein DDE20_18400 [Pararhodobacter oceanensis]|uniref:Integrase catalytic domain-containing protein n=1 Tax=Pararhodobacter oceanensis TaxID=2172121 RepID=A0A2T8HPD2_9RHOB|nr:hypothetical protein DDE20_18400 [Pararhodobacter oceanensis]